MTKRRGQRRECAKNREIALTCAMYNNDDEKMKNHILSNFSTFIFLQHQNINWTSISKTAKRFFGYMKKYKMCFKSQLDFEGGGLYFFLYCILKVIDTENQSFL